LKIDLFTVFTSYLLRHRKGNIFIKFTQKIPKKKYQSIYLEG